MERSPMNHTSVPKFMDFQRGFRRPGSRLAWHDCSPQASGLRLVALMAGRARCSPEVRKIPTAACDGFSLVEVILALGIVSFTLLAIFALFGTTMRSTSETSSQNEVLGITRSLSEFLGSTNAGYGTVSNWVGGGTDPDLFAFLSTNGVVTYGFKTNTTFSSAAGSPATRAGRLFKIVPTLSPAVPGITGPGDLAGQAIIPLHVKIHEVPSLDAPVGSFPPLFIYETSVFK